ncbi:uncharacterized protein LOC111051540 [Nilaparvata lugens]|uniref:uncharacterized protein LOC111051540 n=1 Tax=Nilaparvata lugens TaxID=108931 RepID=UPI00193DC0A9|nr:uncharacterized protein LOC111051540 [Nilaparvata lugens]
MSILTTTVVNKPHALECFEKYSNIHKATRVFAYVLRFIENCKLKKVREHNLRSHTALGARAARTAPPLPSVAECHSAILCIVRLTQAFYFAETLKLLSKEETPPQELLSISPFVDSSGLLRVGGRLRNSSLPYDSRHPLLLPKLSHLSTLICDQTHRDHLHVGPRTTQSLVARKYWIISARNLIRSRLHHCVCCTRMRAQPQQPIMSDLPHFRVNASSVFVHVGVDFAGPFNTKCSSLKKPRVYKGYLALFICLAVKAVHLEYVSELTTESLLAAFDRFTSRRGLPSHVYSDNGLNFVGAAEKLSDISKFLADNKTDIFSALVQREVTWHFNPPSAPNFGGIWEANIKSAKLLLKIRIGDNPMTKEEYFTVFSRIESIMNSRPLLERSQDPNKTPGPHRTSADTRSLSYWPTVATSSRDPAGYYHPRTAAMDSSTPNCADVLESMEYRISTYAYAVKQVEDPLRTLESGSHSAYQEYEYRAHIVASRHSRTNISRTRPSSKSGIDSHRLRPPHVTCKQTHSVANSFIWHPLSERHFL